MWEESKVAALVDVLEADPQMHVADIFSVAGLEGFDGPLEEQIWKGRTVVGGHNIRKGCTREGVILFEQTASRPSTMCAARCAIAHAALKQNVGV